MTTCYACQQPLPGNAPAEMRVLQPLSCGNLREEWVPLCQPCAARLAVQGMVVEFSCGDPVTSQALNAIAAYEDRT